MEDLSLEASVERLHEILVRLARVRPFRDPIAELSDLDLQPPDVHTLMWLGLEGPLAMGELAHHIGTTLPACTRLVDRLNAMGVVLRERDASDRRVVRVRLSAKGQRLHERFQAGMREKLAALLSLLSDTDREQLLAILERLEENYVSRAAEAATVQEKAS